MDKFVVTKSDYKEANIWFDHCIKEQIPYITIIEKRKYCKISWDYISLDKKYVAKILEQSDQLREMFQFIFENYSNDKSTYRYDNLTLTYDKILKSDSTAVAEQLYYSINSIIRN